MPKQLLIKNATLIQPGHSRHLAQTDLFIKNGKIEKIGKNLKEKADELSGPSLYVSAGWIDMRTHLTDPGLEHKDSLKNICNTAAAGGFTHICTLPDSQPVVDNKSSIEYLLNRSAKELTQILPYGTVSEKMEGKDLSEIYDMHKHGAVGFTDADRTINSGLLRKALMYVKPFSGLIVSFPLDRAIHHDGQVNESKNTISTGLRVSPALAEYSCVKQQLDIAAYCEERIHFSGISTKESVELIRQAKKKGQAVTCDTTIFNLCLTDEVSERFDSNLKLMPLLRTETDRKALVKGVNDGTIDAISSNHHPQNIELKKVEFDYADFGALSHQTFWSMYVMHLQQEIKIDTFIRAITLNPASILGVPSALEEGAPATLTVFDASTEWMYNQASSQSISSNSHLLRHSLKGKVLAVANNNTVLQFPIKSS